MNRNLGLMVFCLLLGPVIRAEAGLVVTISSTTIASGGAGQLDVFVQSSTAAPVNVDTFGFEFQVSSSTAAQLAFTTTQLAPFASTNPNYIFLGNSFDQVDGDAQGSVSTSAGGTRNNTYLGDDFTNDGRSVAVGTTPLLLTILQFTTLTQQPAPVGATFTVSLVPSSSPASNLGSSTTFFSVGTTPTFSPYTSTAGTVTVAAPGAVVATPEPSSLVLLVAGGLLTIGARARRGLQRP